MNVTIEHCFCPYCEEVTELYFRIINTILFSTNETELRENMKRLQQNTPLDEYFIFGYGAHHLWVIQRRPSDKTKVFDYRIMMAEF
ncbi:hypothetical protein [Parabacteroides distasonis]|uniref:hypothetical protein n=1 Tax=Parabacteroides distasonis TaxID=823 RepID=UPI00189DF518|nr:hypothetical protein [Parabacteroides distasonis]MDB9154021.1 hypothetical protein [Parabacteroides distasonis]MDB9158586.1 hypothetical protein [Parabacteroides distasonis]MDB9167363.1 hypothetical protein [Parabacteroides distasonis]MDB9171873.1 hypothetical protein [Parabacteroides distasonis]